MPSTSPWQIHGTKPSSRRTHKQVGGSLASVEVRWIDELALGSHSNFFPALFFRQTWFCGRSCFIANHELYDAMRLRDDFDAHLLRRRCFQRRVFKDRFRLNRFDFLRQHPLADVTHDVFVRSLATGEYRVGKTRVHAHDSRQLETKGIERSFGKFAWTELIWWSLRRNGGRRCSCGLGFVPTSWHEESAEEEAGRDFHSAAHSTTRPQESTRTEVRGGGKGLEYEMVDDPSPLEPLGLPVW